MTAPVCAHTHARASVGTGLVSCGGCTITFVDAASARVALGGDHAGQEVELPAEFRARFALGRVIGTGGAGMVVEARSLADGSAVAVKLLARLGDDHLRQRFIQEGQLLARIHHPNLVRLIEVGTLHENPYLVMELLEGGTLRERLSGGALREAEVVRLGIELLEGLDACHRSGVVHRDLKPENLLFDGGGRLRIADLGIAKSYGTVNVRTQVGQILGTPMYMSPEQAQGEPAGVASDLYAVGVILHEALAGEPPFRRGNLVGMLTDRVTTAPRPLSEAAPHVSPALAALIARALARHVADRPATAADFAHALRKAASAPSRPPRGPSPTGRNALPADRRITLALGLASLAGVAAWMLVPGPAPAPRARPVPVSTVRSVTEPAPARSMRSSASAPSPRPSVSVRPPAVASVKSQPPTTAVTYGRVLETVVKLERATLDERAKLRAAMTKLRDENGVPNPSMRLEMAAEPIAPTNPEFHIRLRALAFWRYGEHAVRFPFVERLRVAWLLNPARANGELLQESRRLYAAEHPGWTPPAEPPPPASAPLDWPARSWGNLALDAAVKACYAGADPDAPLTRVIHELQKELASAAWRAPVLARLGVAHLHRQRDLRDLRLAARLLAKSVELEPDANVIGELAVAEGQLGRVDREIELHRRVLALAPHRFETAFFLGLALDRAPRARRHELETLELYKIAVKGDKTFKRFMGWVLLEPGRARRAALDWLELLDRLDKGPLTAAEREQWARRLERDAVGALTMMVAASFAGCSLVPGAESGDLTALLLIAPFLYLLLAKARRRRPPVY
jgi:serine/threonine protein kinase